MQSIHYTKLLILSVTFCHDFWWTYDGFTKKFYKQYNWKKPKCFGLFSCGTTVLIHQKRTASFSEPVIFVTYDGRHYVNSQVNGMFMVEAKIYFMTSKTKMRDTCCNSCFSCHHFIAHSINRFWSWSNKSNTGIDDSLRKVTSFRKKAITRMDGIYTVFLLQKNLTQILWVHNAFSRTNVH